MNKRMILAGLLAASVASAITLEGVEFPDSVKSGEKTLVLNGAGLRSKRKLGMNFRVYVAALYVDKKSSDGNVLLASQAPVVLDMRFLRAVDAKTLRQAWSDEIDKSCEKQCEKAKSGMATFNELVADVKDKSKWTLTFQPATVEAKLLDKTVTIANKDFRDTLLRVFVGANPPTPELRKGLLGL